MGGRFYKVFIIVLLTTVSYLWGALGTGRLKILAIRIDFVADSTISTTGNGKFLLDDNMICANYTIDPPPHDKSFYNSQIIALDNYYQAVSNGKFGIDITSSAIYPIDNNSVYTMPQEMAFYYPALLDLSFEERAEIHEELLVKLFSDALNTANNSDGINFDEYDLVIVIHAGVGQEIVLNEWIDKSAEDIPTTFIDNGMIQKYNNSDMIIGNYRIKQGLIVPETQNYILFPEVVEDQLNNGIINYCARQNALTGTLALFVGQAIGLAPLWNTETGVSGIGVFGLMDVGSNNGSGLIPAPPCAWNRVQMGWELAETIVPDEVVDIDSRPMENIIQVDIDDDEYFLIENRTNWFRTAVSIDSARWSIKSIADTLPNMVEVIFDSIGIVRDENGVVVSVPDYDLGLPGSGLLIWHIDESIISENVSTYSINNDPKSKGIDLEEAGGAQDIGYESTAILRDPAIGEPFDMWYQGNPEFEYFNQTTNNSPLVFNSLTYPNTNSNSGALSNISIGHIGYSSDTMQIAISNDLTLPGFPGTSLHIKYHTDFNGDGKSELIGGEKELWWSEIDNISKQKFYELPSKNNLFTLTDFNNSRQLTVLSDLGDSLEMVWLNIDNGFAMNRTQKFDQDWDSIGYLQGSLESDDVYIIEDKHIITAKNSKVGSSISANIVPNGGISIGDQHAYYQEKEFQYISAIDLNNDGKIELLATDIEGILYAFNQNYTFADGFPIDLNAEPPILGKDILGDTKPEIIFQNSNGEIVVVNYKGELQYRLANTAESRLVQLGEYNGRNTIVSESSIWIFDEISNNNGNEWTSYYADEINSNTIEIDYAVSSTSNDGLIDKKQTFVYPNPIRDGKAKIRIFNIGASHVKIKIYDSAGYFIDEINEEFDTFGSAWETIWDVSDVESGVYLLKVEASLSGIIESVILKVGVIH